MDDYDWEKEARGAEIRVEEMFGYEARKPIQFRIGDPIMTISVRSIWSKDWSEDHEA